MQRIVYTIVIVLLVQTTLAQDYNPERYRKSIFTDILSISNVKYGEAPQWVWPYWEVDLNLDVYLPDGDDNPKRPLIIFAHAGGFINGSKEVDNMVAICDSFARKGYVTASIDYRKGFDPLDAASAERAVYRAIQDGKAAVRYFKENASLYDIDPENIFFGGMSAGGFISLHVAYMDKESERPESTFGGGLVNDLECLDCAGNDFDQTSDVRAILDFWGGVNDTTILEEGNIPMMIMHGEHDPVVPYMFGHPFGLFTLPESFGAVPIIERAENVGIEYEIFTSTGDLHMLDGSDNGTFVEEPNSFWSDTLLPESERFLYEIIKPNTLKISPDTLFACGDLITTFKVDGGDASYYDWIYNEDEITTVFNENTELLTLNFEETGSYDITVVEYNDILAPGDTLVFHVELLDDVIADFSYVNEMATIVLFTNESEGATSYLWDFGDGTMSAEAMEENPFHAFAATGTFDVTLIATNDVGHSDTIVKTLNVGTAIYFQIHIITN